MAESPIPDRDQLMAWLKQAGVAYRLCDRCDGLHIRQLQRLEGVVDSRLFVEPYGLLFTTEVEIRPMAVLPITADLARLNMDYPLLKIFVDVVDDAVPQLVMAGSQLTQAGVAPHQFDHFISAYLESMTQLIEECRHLEYLYLGGSTEVTSRNTLH